MAQKEGEALIRRAPHIDFVLGTNKVHELTRVVQEIAAERGHVVDVQPGETELPEGGPVARQNKFWALMGRTRSEMKAGSSRTIFSSSGSVAQAGSIASCLYSPPRSTA